MVVATCLGHQPRTGLVMPDVVGRLVERRALWSCQVLVAAALPVTAAAGVLACRSAEMRAAASWPIGRGIIYRLRGTCRGTLLWRPGRIRSRAQWR